MVRCFIGTLAAALVLSTGTLGQQQSFDSDCDEVVVGVPRVEAIRRHYYGVHREHDEDIAIVLYRPRDKNGCCSRTNNPDQSGIRPTRFELQVPSQFRVRVNNGTGYSLYKSGSSIELAPKLKVLLLKIRSERDTALGEYVLQGKLAYEALDRSGTPRRVELPLSVSVRLVGNDKKIEQTAWPYGTHVKQTLKTIIQIPVAIPQAIALAIACAGGCDL